VSWIDSERSAGDPTADQRRGTKASQGLRRTGGHPDGTASNESTNIVDVE
jgi:hypothetical protein